MPKRKRESPPTHPSKSSDPADRQKKQCLTRVTAAQKPLVAALRHGAGLERQKYSRRKKFAVKKGNSKDLARLEAEYGVLKGLDMEKLADQHIRRTLGKVKSLKDTEALKEYVEGIEKPGTAADIHMLNVTARLYKVHAVKQVVDKVVEELKEILCVSTAPTATQISKVVGEKQPQAMEEDDMTMLDGSGEEGDPYELFNARIAAPSSGEEDSQSSVTDDERPPSVADSDGEQDPDHDLEAGSDDSDSEPDRDAPDNDNIVKRSKHSTALSRSVAPPSDGSDSESEDESVTSMKKRKTEAEPLNTTSSAFLPGLSHAAYLSGSESEASDLDAEIAPRKNRRGQRARQKIAEAKFGAAAKHLEKQRRNEGWDPKRGAVGDRKRRGGERGDKGKVPKGRGPQQSGENAEPLGERKGGGVVVHKKERDDSGVLHPSWQAAKMVKESKKLNIVIGGAKTTGKKVVFD